MKNTDIKAKKKTNKSGLFLLFASFALIIGALVAALSYFTKTITKLIVTSDDLDDETFL